MKKSLACLVGLFALATAVAQPPASKGTGIIPAAATAPASAPTSPPATRIAVLNINKVLKDYAKAQSLNSAIKMKVQGYADKMASIRNEINKLTAEMSKPTTPAMTKEQNEKQILNLNRQLQDIDNEARRVISKEQGDIAVQIFREIEGVVQAVAVANGFDLVLSYPDATTPEEMYSQDNVVRKLASQAAIPMFSRGHIDLTAAVVLTLNRSYPVAAPAPTAPAAPPAAPR